MIRISKSFGALVTLLFSLALAGCAGPGMLNSFSSDVGYQLTPNISYDSELNLALDVYQPTKTTSAPVVVFFHGGRWSQGSKDDYKFVGQALASRGYVAVIPDFRQYPAVRFPAFVKDAARAVRWARDNAARYGGNPNLLFVMGHQSGGQIAALLALDKEYLKGVGGDRSWLRGMIGLAGAYDFMPITAPDLRDLFGPVDRFAYSQPIYFVDGQNPPLLLIHGRDDKDVWVSNTINLARAVSKAGGPVETVLYDKLSNEMIIGSLASFLRGRADVLDNIDDFIQRTIKAPARPQTQTEIKATPLVQDPVQIQGQELPPPQAVDDAPPATPQPLQWQPAPQSAPSAGQAPDAQPDASPGPGQ